MATKARERLRMRVLRALGERGVCFLAWWGPEGGREGGREEGRGPGDERQGGWK
jgi:hypothetical protein